RSTQFTLLAALELAGPMTMGALAELLAADRTTLTRNLAVLSGHGLVLVVAGIEDARSRIASITPAGHDLLVETLPTWRNAQAELTQTLGEQAAKGLQQLAGGPCVMPIPNSEPSPNGTTNGTHDSH
ncbi:MAG: MarR family winged helix-turn-helix transcriptional regulator, partial [Xanthomonadales bacterium]|nr:MarR family winged helix-turn-helix transcriptional regulator [Xanthomonadales bacterium]